MMFNRKSFLRSSVAAVLLGLAAAPAMALDFAGKKITIMVPFKEGGGSDGYARTLQPFLSKHLPGNPRIIVKNVPGGGSIKGANKFQMTEGDGLTAMVASTSTFTSSIFGGDKARYDMTSWEPVVLSPQGSILFTTSKAGIGGMSPAGAVEKLRAASHKFGIKSPTGSELRAVAAFNLLGIENIEPVFGLGAGARRQAMIRGELDLGVEPFSAFKRKVAPYTESGELTAFATLGFFDDFDNVIRDPGLPNMKTVYEIYRELNGRAPEGQLWEAYRRLVYMGVMTSKSLFLPQGTSPEIVKVWSDAVKKTLSDPKFIEASGGDFSVYPQLFGNSAKRSVLNALTMSDTQREWFFSWIEKTMKVPL
ncbi:hypothetical protein [Motiliproteus sp. MSK22-1]|uniref:hypothetical protein n=1 Tax=Motiliproteus sp. MSK22-1 TaxID=1897630 RepID=UPI0009765B9A|nr:hypothetical protein [Motiliproteus sp. MSK22-1]OMH27551.1 hypothetical protein BGP75_22530 [Motiliproteus sp. MSK22-1]